MNRPTNIARKRAYNRQRRGEEMNTLQAERNRIKAEVEKASKDLIGLHSGTDMLQIGIRMGIEEFKADVLKIVWSNE